MKLSLACCSFIWQDRLLEVCGALQCAWTNYSFWQKKTCPLYSDFDSHHFALPFGIVEASNAVREPTIPTAQVDEGKSLGHLHRGLTEDEFLS